MRRPGHVHPSLEAVLAHWDLPSVRSVERLDGQDHVFRVQTAGQAMILKDVGAKSHGRQHLELIQGVLDHLASRGVPVAIPIRSRSGLIAVQSSGRHFQLLEYIEAGGYPEDSELGGEVYRQVGAAIADLHEALASYEDADLRKIRREDMARGVVASLSLLRENLFGHQAAIVGRVEQERGAEMARALSGLPEQLIHRDCHPGNVLVDGMRVVGFIDCDHFCIGPPSFDLATYAVNRVKWTRDESLRDAWLRDLPHLLEGYRARRGLSDRELNGVPSHDDGLPHPARALVHEHISDGLHSDGPRSSPVDS